MRIRGTYFVSQIDQTRNEEDVRVEAINNIALQFGNSIMTQWRDKLIKEEPNDYNPYGRYYLDIEVEVVDSITGELGGDVGGISTIGG